MEYTGYLTEGNYEAMYLMLDSGSRMDISQEEFITRNKKIYEGIGASSIQVDIAGVEEKEDQGIQTVSYETSMESLAGTIHFFNQVDFKLEASSGAVGTDSHDSAGSEHMVPAQATVMMLGVSPSLPQLTITAGTG